MSSDSNPIEVILLDMDGTMVDAFPPIIRALNQTFAEYGMPQMTPQEVKRHTGRGDCSMISLFGGRREEAGKRFLEIHDEDYLDHITPLDGAETLLHWLNEQNMPCAIVTSKSQSRAEAQLDILGWTDFIAAVIGKVDGRPEKPDPTPLLLACDALSVNPLNSVMVGDGVADMKAASRAGSRGLGLCGTFSSNELKEAGAHLCFHSLGEIHTWLSSRL